ncbi:hypothetical protein Tco_1270073 [Tanacetum coccineum]
MVNILFRGSLSLTCLTIYMHHLRGSVSLLLLIFITTASLYFYCSDSFFLIVRHGGQFEYWKAGLVVVVRLGLVVVIIVRDDDEKPSYPPAPAADSAANVLTEWNAVYDTHNEVACLMLGSMTPELHSQFENSSPYEILQELKFMFEKQAGVERFDLIQTFHACKQEEGKPVGQYVLKMQGHVEQLERLGYVLL